MMSCRTRRVALAVNAAIGLVRETLAQPAQLPVFGTKLVAPLRDAVRLVDRKNEIGTRAEPLERVRARQPLRRNIQQPVSPSRALANQLRSAPHPRASYSAPPPEFPSARAAPPGPASARSAAKSRSRSAPEASPRAAGSTATCLRRSASPRTYRDLPAGCARCGAAADETSRTPSSAAAPREALLQKSSREYSRPPTSVDIGTIALEKIRIAVQRSRRTGEPQISAPATPIRIKI